MPVISRFLGITVVMYYRDQAPPHLHALYGGYEVTVEIETGMVAGRFPRRPLALLLDWWEYSREDLRANWDRARLGLPVVPIAPGNRHMSLIVPAILHVTDARVLSAYRLWLRFNDGAEGVADLSADLDAPVFEPLKDPAHFAVGQLDPLLHTVVWPCGADFAPEFLRSRITTASV